MKNTTFSLNQELHNRYIGNLLVLSLITSIIVIINFISAYLMWVVVVTFILIAICVCKSRGVVCRST